MDNLNGSYTYNEIMSQGEIWKKVLEKSSSQLSHIEEWIRKPHDEVIFIGCGSTHYLSLSAAKVWTSLTNEPARGIPSSEIWYYPLSTFSRQKPLLVAISRSGETTETLKAIDVYKAKYKEESLVICCYPESSMVNSAKLKMLATDAFETSIAQTRSFSSMYILSQVLGGHASKNDKFILELTELPSLFLKTVKNYEPLIKEIGSDPLYQHFVFLGSGVNFGLASETMLKMKEMSTSVSEVFNFMEYRHGPMSMITKQSLVIGFISDARKNEELQVLRDMKSLGATTLALVENSSGVDADHIIELNSNISDVARGAIYLPFLQLLGFYHSISRGLNPDKPTNLSSVVYL
jgi:glutamine---fructose-6-phosphate transaminase (isomerizing)